MVKQKKKRLYLGPSALCFDSKNDDLIILDVYRLRRFQCRDDRKKYKDDETQPYPQLKFNLNTETKFINRRSNNDNLKLRGAETGELNYYLLKSYLSQFLKIIEKSVPVTEDNIKNVCEDTIKELKVRLKNFL